MVKNSIETERNWEEEKYTISYHFACKCPEWSKFCMKNREIDWCLNLTVVYFCADLCAIKIAIWNLSHFAQPSFFNEMQRVNEWTTKKYKKRKIDVIRYEPRSHSM